MRRRYSLILGTAILGLMATALLGQPARAAVLLITYSSANAYGAVRPAGPDPFMTSLFDDEGSAGSVNLTISVANTVATADVTGLFFNLNPLLDPTDLVFTRTGGTGPVATDITVITGLNTQNDNPSTGYDIEIGLPPPPGSQAARLNAGETLIFAITGIATLTANDFNFLNSDTDPGPFVSTSRWQDTVDGGSDKIGGAVVPLPAALPLFLSALAGFGFIVRHGKKQAA